MEWHFINIIAAAAVAKSLQSCLTLCDSRDGSPPGSPRPWDSPGKNTGVGCHFLLQCMKVKSESKVARSCPTPSDPMDCSLPGSSVHGIFQARVLEWGAIAFSEPLCNVIQLQKIHVCHFWSSQQYSVIRNIISIIIGNNSQDLWLLTMCLVLCQ